jgi:FkbM family methyltransferase
MGTSTPEVKTISVRGTQLKFSVSNNLLHFWADRFEEIEPELLDLFDALPEHAVIYDAGASIGLFSLYAAITKRAEIYAFEPEAQNYATLEMNSMLNRDKMFRPLTALNVALSDSVGLGHIHARTYGAGEHGKILDRAITQDTKAGFNPEHIQAVLKLPLDEAVKMCNFPAPSFLKIDVDGAEASVLRGATSLLQNGSLKTIFIELSDNSTTEEVSILEKNGFKLSQKFPVVDLFSDEPFYPGLFNCVYRRA